MDPETPLRGYFRTASPDADLSGVGNTSPEDETPAPRKIGQRGTFRDALDNARYGHLLDPDRVLDLAYDGAACRTGKPPVDADLDDPTVGAYRDAAAALRWDVFRIARQAFNGNVAASIESDPYPDHAAILDAAASANKGDCDFRVSDVNHAHPIWSDADNYLFRVHHDASHVLGSEPDWPPVAPLDVILRDGTRAPRFESFTYTGEVQTAIWQAQRIARNGASREAASVIIAEIVFQAAYFEVHGVFPTSTTGLREWQTVVPRPWLRGFGI